MQFSGPCISASLKGLPFTVRKDTGAVSQEASVLKMKMCGKKDWVIVRDHIETDGKVKINPLAAEDTVFRAVVSLHQKNKDLPILAKSLKFLEAATGFEPVNNGFADRCLSHLAMPPVLWICGAGNGT